MQPLFDIQELFFHITHVVCNLEYKAKGHIEPTLEVSASLKKNTAKTKYMAYRFKRQHSCEYG